MPKSYARLQWKRGGMPARLIAAGLSLGVAAGLVAGCGAAGTPNRALATARHTVAGDLTSTLQPAATTRTPEATRRTPDATATSRADAAASLELPGASIYDFCIRPQAGDVLFSMLLPKVEDPADRGAPYLHVYRSPLGPDGALGPVTLFADLSERYAAAEAWIERVQCHADADRVLLTVGKQDRMNGGGWWTELWLLEADGRPVVDHALAREIGPTNVAWSPDGLRLLVEDVGGRVYVYDLDTEEAELLEGVGLSTVAGAGGGWLHWSGDGRLGILESIVGPVDGVAARSMEVVDLAGPSPRLIGVRELPAASDTAMQPRGGMIVLTPGFGSTRPRPSRLACRDGIPPNPVTAPHPSASCL